MKHTATPWSHREAYHKGEPVGFVVQSGVQGLFDVDKEADAAFIVKACNAHEELVEALKMAVDDLEEGCYAVSTREAAIKALDKA